MIDVENFDNYQIAELSSKELAIISETEKQIKKQTEGDIVLIAYKKK